MSTVCGKMISACVQASQTPLLICISSFSAADCNCGAEVLEYPQTEDRRLCRCDRSVSASSAISLPRSSPCHGSCSSFTTTFISVYYLIFRGRLQLRRGTFRGRLDGGHASLRGGFAHRRGGFAHHRGLSTFQPFNSLCVRQICRAICRARCRGLSTFQPFNFSTFNCPGVCPHYRPWGLSPLLQLFNLSTFQLFNCPVVNCPVVCPHYFALIGTKTVRNT